jgi:hypothetical protein
MADHLGRSLEIALVHDNNSIGRWEVINYEMPYL